MQTPLDRETLRAANINPDTGLATDFLNHYNEAAMLIGMLRDMPDMADAVLEWAPVTYAEHFRVTHFRDRELAVAAYEQASPQVIARFDAARARVERAIIDVQDALRRSPGRAAAFSSHAEGIFVLIAAVGGVINGGRSEALVEPADGAQSAIDALFG